MRRIDPGNHETGQAYPKSTRIAAPDEVAAIEWLTAAEVLDNPKAPPWTRLSIEAAERWRHRERLRDKG